MPIQNNPFQFELGKYLELFERLFWTTSLESFNNRNTFFYKKKLFA